MKYFTLFLAVGHFLLFAWDIENDRDFSTWLWLLYSIWCFCISIKLGLLKPYKNDEN